MSLPHSIGLIESIDQRWKVDEGFPLSHNPGGCGDRWLPDDCRQLRGGLGPNVFEGKGLAKDMPQGLKPDVFYCLCGMTEVVP